MWIKPPPARCDQPGDGAKPGSGDDEGARLSSAEPAPVTRRVLIVLQHPRRNAVDLGLGEARFKRQFGIVLRVEDPEKPAAEHPGEERQHDQEHVAHRLPRFAVMPACSAAATFASASSPGNALASSADANARLASRLTAYFSIR